MPAKRKKFITVTQARRQLAAEWRENALAIRHGGSYAAHVTEETKDRRYQEALQFADGIERGLHDSNLTVAQKLLVIMTGNCPPLVPKDRRHPLK